MDRAVCEKQQDLIAKLTLHLELGHVFFELLEQWGKEGWPSKANLWQRIPVSLDHVLNPVNLRLSHVSIDSKAVGHCIHAHVAGNASKTKAREGFIRVIRFKNLAN